MNASTYAARSLSFGAACAVLTMAPLAASAGIVNGVHGPVVRVCFAGDAVTSKPDDVKFVWDHLMVFENHGHIKFVLMENGGRCPPPRPGTDAKFDFHDGDLRIGIFGTLDIDGKTPLVGSLGKGCAERPTAPWWSNFPSNKDKQQFRACRITTFLRKPMRLNKILHEIGHSLGMHHEHARPDVPRADPMVATCFKDVKYFGRGSALGQPGVTHVTPYDRDSVMHYEINRRIDPTNVATTSACNIGNDNGNTGLSAFDQLTIRIVYPFDRRIAEFRGKTVVVVGEQVKLENEWGALGALVGIVVRNPTWMVTRDNVRVTEQKSPNFAYKFDTPGAYAVRYTFNDAYGRAFANSLIIRVLTPDQMRSANGGSTAINAMLF